MSSWTPLRRSGCSPSMLSSRLRTCLFRSSHPTSLLKVRMTFLRLWRRSGQDRTPASNSWVWSSPSMTSGLSWAGTFGTTSRKCSETRSSGRSFRGAFASKKARRIRNRSSASRPTQRERSNTTNFRKRSSDVSKQRGLPEQRRMRHDFHFVDNLTGAPSPGVGRMIPLELLVPNPDQPRRSFGDMADLVSSIKEKGVLEPVLVRPTGDKYQIIAGERRYRASVEAGLSQIPCVEIDVDDRGVLEISLIENLQRRDLNPFEEAEGLQKLCDKFLYTHEDVAKKLGKARTSVTETLTLNHIPADLRERCRSLGIFSRSTLLQIARQPNRDAMSRMIEEIKHAGLTRDDLRKMKDEKKGPGRPKGFVFHFRPPDNKFTLDLKFKRSEVSKSDIIATLRELIESLANS